MTDKRHDDFTRDIEGLLNDTIEAIAQKYGVFAKSHPKIKFEDFRVNSSDDKFYPGDIVWHYLDGKLRKLEVASFDSQKLIEGDFIVVDTGSSCFQVRKDNLFHSAEKASLTGMRDIRVKCIACCQRWIT